MNKKKPFQHVLQPKHIPKRLTLVDINILLLTLTKVFSIQ